MRTNTVKEALLDGQTVINGWLGIPSPYSAEILGHCGFDSITVDLQHGMIGFDQALPMLQALGSTPSVPMVRVPGLDGPQIMHLLDAGAYGVICPMISTPEDARKLVSICRYPPLGTRSFGPARYMLSGLESDYHLHANEEVLIMGMIETREALDNLDAILATEGLDGVYVGPNDLSLALGHSPSSAPDAEEVLEAIERICERSLAHGKIPGIFCADGETARARLDEGFRMVTPNSDTSLLQRASLDAVARIRQTVDIDTEDTPGGY